MTHAYNPDRQREYNKRAQAKAAKQFRQSRERHEAVRSKPEHDFEKWQCHIGITNCQGKALTEGMPRKWTNDPQQTTRNGGTNGDGTDIGCHKAPIPIPKRRR